MCAHKPDSVGSDNMAKLCKITVISLTGTYSYILPEYDAPMLKQWQNQYYPDLIKENLALFRLFHYLVVDIT